MSSDTTPPGASPPTSLPPFDPNERNAIPAIICLAIAQALSAAAVALRFWARAGILHVLALEDWFILASVGFSLAATGTFFAQLDYGMGKHITFVSLQDLTLFFEISLATSIVYVLTLGFTKLSILCLYIRVLTYDHVRRAAKTLLAIVIISHLYILATLLTSCVPLSAFWDLGPGRANAYCHPMPVYWSHAGINIVTDFLIFVLPLTVIHKIRTPLPQKIVLLVVFLLAFVVCIISVIRAVLLARDLDAGALDVTWDGAKTAIWNIWEVNIAIICACLTTMKPIVSKFWPRLLSPHPSTMPGEEDISAVRGPRGGRRQFGMGTGLSSVGGHDLDVEAEGSREAKVHRSHSDESMVVDEAVQSHIEGNKPG